MSRPEGAHEAHVSVTVDDLGAKPRRKWTWPDHIGRLRTSTVVLIVAFLGTALLRSYLMAAEPEPSQPDAAVLVPMETTQYQPPTTTLPPTTTTPPPSTTTGQEGSATGTSDTPTTSPLIVLPPGLVPSGVELPPGVAVETTTAPTPSASVAPTTTP
ncbi:hypothetical protein [Rhodococcus gannanensis]|uniref:Serine/threonine protein kinase n=1 Tax=Rhodococcus gannanensis TaxID=1960308 RepID=A0ABW4P5T7_9NOCA